jgi:predicted MPP superfamily phosphohydrolase
MIFETTWLKIERLDFSRNGNGLRIMHLSDLHINMTRISAGRIRKVVKAENPDLILITGDYINVPLHASLFLKYLHVFCKGYRTVMCLGNHDIRAFGRSKEGLENFIREMEALNVEVLRNRTVIAEKNGKKYNIIGIDDLRKDNPDVVLRIPGKIVDYLFAGHFHGGQIWMPYNLEFFLFRDDVLCRMGIKKGLKCINGIRVYLNRGLGNVVVPLRFLSRPEILICTLP